MEDAGEEAFRLCAAPQRSGGPRGLTSPSLLTRRFPETPPAPGQWPWRTSGFPLYEHATAVPAGARRMPHFWMVNLGSAETLSRTSRRTIDGLCPSYWQVILVGSNHPRSGYHARQRSDIRSPMSQIWVNSCGSRGAIEGSRLSLAGARWAGHGAVVVTPMTARLSSPTAFSELLPIAPHAPGVGVDLGIDPRVEAIPIINARPPAPPRDDPDASFAFLLSGTRGQTADAQSSGPSRQGGRDEPPDCRDSARTRTPGPRPRIRPVARDLIAGGSGRPS